MGSRTNLTVFEQLGELMTSVAKLASAKSRQRQSEVAPDPLKTAKGVYVTVHGHFYQPPRENPYLDAIERQPSAFPFHDWNERIHHECYRPNVFARVLNDQGKVVGIVNNFEYLSFNVGPTLMSWLERYDMEVYQRILEADRRSCQRLNGHGNAIAQAYNHIILPLANPRDKITQIRWGIADFRSRFKRDPEGMWLAETAVDYLTLEALVQEGIRFIILAPTQAERCRPLPTEDESDPEWHEVGGSQIDPTRPYRCFLDKDKYIDLFFYDGPISGDMGFSDLLNSSQIFAGRLGQAVHGDRRPSQLISVATDGETFGHHKQGTEKCLAYAFTGEFPGRGWTVTNYAHYLSICPPTWEVQLKPVTAWSCSHGVSRWQDDCGCGGGDVWHQKWRRPLREALNWLRDELAEIFEQQGRKLFNDPWQTRDDYVEILRTRESFSDRARSKVEEFLVRHQCRSLSLAEQVDALRLLEMQRHSLLMFTSCGWFFEEISRPEGVQILRYASRAIELATELTGTNLEPQFIKRLALAPSNVECFGTGAEVYRQLVQTAQVSFQQVAAHYAISSLFTSFPEQARVYCYDIQQLDYQRQTIGTLTLALGQVRIVSEITWESTELVFAVLHLGGWDFHCCIQNFQKRKTYGELKEKLFEVLKSASAAKTISAMSQWFNDQCIDLEHLFAEERQRIMQQLTEETKTRLDQLYTQVYRDNYGVLVAFRRDRLPVPVELQVAAEIALSTRCLSEMMSLELAGDDPEQIRVVLPELEAIATEANTLDCQLKIPEAKNILEQLILRLLWHLLYDNNPATLEDDLKLLERIITVGEQLKLDLSLERPQEIYFNCLHNAIVPQCFPSEKSPSNGENLACRWDFAQLSLLLKLGEKLAVDVSPWLK